jgi:hypothetical protein
MPQKVAGLGSYTTFSKSSTNTTKFKTIFTKSVINAMGLYEFQGGCSINGFLDAVVRRDRMLLGTTTPILAFLVRYTVNAPNAPYTVADLTNILVSAVTSGQITSSLRNYGFSSVNASIAPSVLDISPTLPPTPAPSVSPTVKPLFNRDQLIGVCVGSILGGCIIFACLGVCSLIITKKRKSKSGSGDNAEASGDDQNGEPVFNDLQISSNNA